MLIKFSKILLHNFLSFSDAEVYLNDRHYCLVSGQNNNSDDNAISNGSGKSSLFSGICWALTGETISGLTSNIKNINVDDDSCWVQLDFTVDKDHFVITRTKNPKSDLKIILNNNDISGKGIRESEAILSQYLPDLTSQLIGSIIVLGQGLPCKFTANTPSGRKEVLEKLSKSDFMISDLKDRITKRSQSLSLQLRSFEDAILEKTANKNLLEKQGKEQEAIIKQLEIPVDFDSKIAELNSCICELNNVISQNIETINTATLESDEISNKLNELLSEKSRQIDQENANFNSINEQYLDKRSNILSDIKTLQTSIDKVKNIRDICPTCGQKIPNIVKPSVVNEEKQLTELNTSLLDITAKFEIIKKQHQEMLNKIDTDNDKAISDINYQIKQVKEKIRLYQSDNQSKQKGIFDYTNQLTKVQSEKDTYTATLENAKKTLYNINLSIEKLQKEILYNNSEKEKIQDHINVVNQMMTLIKRDFRGFLLNNIITFIDQKIKIYANQVFNTKDLNFTLDGNNINITFCRKLFENLSGGEQQKIDIIIQLAIRDMMKQYLGFSSNILVLDEIFDQLDNIGCTNILNLISNSLDDVESIFIISHRADDLEIPADSEILIIKDHQGVSIVK